MVRYEDKEEKEKKPEEDKSLDGRLFKGRTVLISGEVNGALAEKIVKQLLALDNENSEAIYVYIDSPGGSIDSGFAIFDTIRYINSPVYCIVMGLAASMGAMILLAADKSRRVGFSHSRYLIHQPLSGIRGVATEIEIHAAELEKYRVLINNIIAKECEKNVEDVAKDTDRDYWLNATEAVAYGLISRTIVKKSDLQ